MTRIYCADIACKFCNDKGVCTAKEVALSWNSVMTAWDGRQDFNTCRTKELSERAKEAQEIVKRVYGKDELHDAYTGK